MGAPLRMVYDLGCWGHPCEVKDKCNVHFGLLFGKGMRAKASESENEGDTLGRNEREQGAREHPREHPCKGV